MLGLTDRLDGYLARRLGLVSRSGQCLDPLFDRVGVIVIMQPTRIGKLRTALLLLGFPVLILGAPQALDSEALAATAGVLLALGAVGHLVAGAQYARALLAAGGTRRSGRSAA